MDLECLVNSSCPAKTHSAVKTRSMIRLYHVISNQTPMATANTAEAGNQIAPFITRKGFPDFTIGAHSENFEAMALTIL